MSMLIDIAFPIVQWHRNALERRIRQIIYELPGGLWFVRVQVVPATVIVERVVGEVYRVTLCGQGGVPLPAEKEFLLYQKEVQGKFILQYITKPATQS